MHPASLLELCAELIRTTLKLDAPADGVVSGFFRVHRNLGPRERHTLAETAYAVLRKRLLFQHLAQGASGALERRLAILGWQGAEGFLQGALEAHERQWLERCRAVDISTLQDKLRHNLPDWLAGALREQLPAEQFWPLAEALMQPAPLDLRSTPSRPSARRCSASWPRPASRPCPRPFRPGACACRASRP